MSIFHFHLNPLRRHSGKSTLREVAYAAGISLCDPVTNKTHDFSDRKDVRRSKLVGSDRPRQQVWMRAELAERRQKAVVGRSVVIAVPVELSEDENWQLLVGYSRELVERFGVVVDVSLHDPARRRGQPRNPHGHLIMSSRRWDEESGEFGEKTRELDMIRTGSLAIREMRERWELAVNSALPPGVRPVSCASHETLGDGLIPQRHRGEIATRMKDRGTVTQIDLENALIAERNRLVVELKRLEERSVCLEAEANFGDLHPPATSTQPLAKRPQRAAAAEPEIEGFELPEIPPPRASRTEIEIDGPDF